VSNLGSEFGGDPYTGGLRAAGDGYPAPVMPAPAAGPSAEGSHGRDPWSGDLPGGGLQGFPVDPYAAPVPGVYAGPAPESDGRVHGHADPYPSPYGYPYEPSGPGAAHNGGAGQDGYGGGAPDGGFAGYGSGTAPAGDSWYGTGAPEAQQYPPAGAWLAAPEQAFPHPPAAPAAYDSGHLAFPDLPDLPTAAATAPPDGPPPGGVFGGEAPEAFAGGEFAHGYDARLPDAGPWPHSAPGLPTADAPAATPVGTPYGTDLAAAPYSAPPAGEYGYDPLGTGVPHPAARHDTAPEYGAGNHPAAATGAPGTPHGHSAPGAGNHHADAAAPAGPGAPAHGAGRSGHADPTAPAHHPEDTGHPDPAGPGPEHGDALGPVPGHGPAAPPTPSGARRGGTPAPRRPGRRRRARAGTRPGPDALRRLVPQALVVAFIAGGTSAFVAHDKTIRLTVDGVPRTLHTFADDVDELLDDEDLTVGAHDLVAPAPGTSLSSGDEIVVRYGRPLTLTLDGSPRRVWTTADTVGGALRQLGVRADGAHLSVSRSAAISRRGLALDVRTERTVTFVVDGRERPFRTTAATVGDALTEAGITLSRQDTVSVPPESFPADGQTVTVLRITGGRETREERVPYRTVRIEDPNEFAGKEVVEEPGRDGLRRVTYELRKVDGVAQRPRKVSDELVRAPVDRRVRVGTKPMPRSVPGADGLNWAALAQCESGGRPNVVDPSGTYGGLYQFDTPTWQSLGGSGRPQNASPEEQTYRAKQLYKQRGASPWPHCGSRLGG
jgi:resuscitation-promoting factor RpfB